MSEIVISVNNICDLKNLRIFNLLLQQNDNVCPICYKNVEKKNAFVTMCGHLFCVPCTSNHVKFSTTCPMCKYNCFGTDCTECGVQNLSINNLQENMSLVGSIRNLSIDNLDEHMLFFEPRDNQYVPQNLSETRLHLNQQRIRSMRSINSTLNKELNTINNRLSEINIIFDNITIDNLDEIQKLFVCRLCDINCFVSDENIYCKYNRLIKIYPVIYSQGITYYKCPNCTQSLE